MMNKMNVRYLSRSVLALLLCSQLLACGSADEEEPLPLRPVRTIVVSADAASNLKTFTGVSRSAQESRLSFKVGGTITEIPVSVGDSIKAGTVIARIDSSTYELQKQQAQATVAQSSAAARNARAAYERTRGLYANNNVSLGELEGARANSDSASAQLRAANKSLQLAELNLSYTALTVDIDCVVDSILVAENENVNAGTAVARVNCSEELEIEVAVPEGLIDDFTRGKTADIEFDAIEDNSFKGTVIEVGVDAGGAGSTFPVTVLVNEQHPSMRSGLAASVSFVTAADGRDEHVLPLSTIVRRSGATYVYVVNEAGEQENTGTVQLRNVELGELLTSGVEVLSGLEQGDRVVIAGVSFLRDGLEVLY